MASTHNSKIQGEKMKQLTAAYNDLKKELDQRLEAIIAELDNAKDRDFWYKRWEITHTLMEADYLRWMDGITKGEM